MGTGRISMGQDAKFSKQANKTKKSRYLLPCNIQLEKHKYHENRLRTYNIACKNRESACK